MKRLDVRCDRWGGNLGGGWVEGNSAGGGSLGWRGRIQRLCGCPICRGLVGRRGWGGEGTKRVGVCTATLHAGRGLGSAGGAGWKGYLWYRVQGPVLQLQIEVHEEGGRGVRLGTG